MIEIDELLGDLGHRGVGWEALTLLACLVAAYGICWLTGRRHPPESVLFGRRLVDGVLFPVLALVLTYSARVAVGGLQPVPLLRLAVPLLISATGIRLLSGVLPLVFPRWLWARIAVKLFSWLAAIAAVLWVLGLLQPVLNEMESIRFTFGQTRLSLLGMLQGLLSAGLVLVLALWVSAAVERKVLRDAVADLSLRRAAAHGIRVALLAFGFVFALSAAGVDLTALSVLGGALGVGLGFGLQKLAANYVSGFVILAERSLRIGDMVKIDGFEGVVADIKTRYTLIRAPDGRASVVPNEKLISERVENLSISDPRVVLATDVTVHHESDPDVVQQLLVDCALRTQRVLADPEPSARLLRFGVEGLEFRIFFWIDDPQNGQINVKSDVNLRVLKALREAGIAIPYPQRVVRLVGHGGADAPDIDLEAPVPGRGGPAGARPL